MNRGSKIVKGEDSLGRRKSLGKRLYDFGAEDGREAGASNRTRRM